MVFIKRLAFLVDGEHKIKQIFLAKLVKKNGLGEKSHIYEKKLMWK